MLSYIPAIVQVLIVIIYYNTERLILIGQKVEARDLNDMRN